MVVPDDTVHSEPLVALALARGRPFRRVLERIQGKAERRGSVHRDHCVQQCGMYSKPAAKFRLECGKLHPHTAELTEDAEQKMEEVEEMDVEVEVEVEAGLKVEADVGAELELALEAEARAAAAEAEARAKAREVATALLEAEAASPAALRVCSSRCTLLSEVLAAAIATGGGAEGGAGCHLLGLPPSTLQAEQTKVVVGARLQAEAETALVPAMECPAVGAAKVIETAEATEAAEAVEATEATNASISSAAAEPDCLTPMQAPPVPSPSEVAPSSPPQTHLSSRLGPRWVSTVSPW